MFASRCSPSLPSLFRILLSIPGVDLCSVTPLIKRLAYLGNVHSIDYFLTTPLILLALFLSSGIPWATILYTILIDWVMVVSFLVGTLVKSTYKFGYFTFAVVAYLFIAYQLLFAARSYAAELGGTI